MATKSRSALKFDDCVDCKFQGTWRCVRCSTGEFFEEKDAEELDIDTLDFRGGYDD